MSDLDQFFAKKDKKKTKSKPNYVATDELYKNLEESTKLDITPRRLRKNSDYGKSHSSSSSINVEHLVYKSANDSDGDEWREFTEEEQRKDYTGLKIAQLSIEDIDGDCDEDGVGGGVGSAADDPENFTNCNQSNNNNLLSASSIVRDGFGDGVGESNSNVCGPWKKLSSSNVTIEVEVTSDESRKPPKKVYVPPALRRSHGDAADMQLKKSNTHEAPDLNSVEYFPTLGSIKSIKTKK